MPQADGPIVDAQNPCYCPETTAGQFIERLFARDDHAPVLVSTFAQILDDQSASFNVVEQEQDKSPAPWLDSSGDTSGSSASLVADPAGGTGRRVNRTDLAFAADLSYGGLSSISSGEESEESMSSSVSQYLGELDGSDMYAQSDLYGDDASYDIEGKATQIKTFFPPRSGYSSPFPPYSAPRVAGDQRVHVLEDELYGPFIGSETPTGLHSLIVRLEAMLPGLRLQERLYVLDPLIHQSIVDVLGDEGLLNACVLEVFRGSEIWRLGLSNSIRNELGLNIAGIDALKVLTKPHSFQCLTELNLSETPLRDFDLVHVHHLPRLRTLLLNNTGLGNEGVFHLVALRRTLSYLHLEENPSIDDDAVPALLLLNKLRFMSLLDTGVHMPGIRRLAAVLKKESRRLDVTIPLVCEDYLNRLNTQYALQPEPQLLTDASAVGTLSAAALRRNLLAHAAHSAAVVAGGTKSDMAARLGELLERRAADLVVRELLWGGEGPKAGESESMDL